MKVLKWLKEENRWLIFLVSVLSIILFSSLAIIQDIKYAEVINRLSRLFDEITVVI